MKRFLICCFVLTLVFCLGGYSGMFWHQQIASNRSAPSTVYADAISDNARFEATPPTGLIDDGLRATVVAPPQFVDTPVPPPRFEVSQAPQAILVSDRFAPVQSNVRDSVHQAAQQVAQRFSDAESRGSFSPPPVAQPDLFETPADPSTSQPARFNSRQPAAAVPNNAVPTPVVNLMEGMSYLIRVDREDNSPIQKIKMQRMYGGKRTVVLDLPEQHSLPELRVFAEAVEVTSEDGEFRLKCEGKVAVVANQSMLWGEGLELENGVFKIAEAEVVTPDAVIKSGGCEFEFSVGGISVDRIGNGDQEVNAETDEVANTNEDATQGFPIETLTQ